jgi:hypothetical protein
MSEEVKIPETEVNGNEQADNGEHKVPVSALVAERKKYQQKIEELERFNESLKSKAEIADELTSLSNKDINQIKAELAGMKNKQTYQQPTQNLKPSYDDSKVKALEERLENEIMEREFERFSKASPIEMTQDMKDDIISFARKTNMSIKESAFARYGEYMIEQKAKTEERNDKLGNASRSMISASGGSIPSGANTLPNDLKSLAQEVGLNMDSNRLAILASGDISAMKELYKKK